MAFPFIIHSNFEGGTTGEWSSESDTGSLLDVVHYSDLAKDSTSLMPYHGAYCLRNRLGDTNDHTLTQTSIDIADGSTSFFRWYMGLSRDFAFTADDTFNVFELQQAGGTPEISVGMRVTNASRAIEIGIGDGTAPTVFAPWQVPLGKWACVELLVTVSTVGAGVVTLFVEGTQVLTLTAQTHAAAVGQGVLGSQDTLASTTGAIYFDEFVMDDGRVFPERERFPYAVQILKNTHVFVGPGHIDGVVLQALTGANETLSLFDTDTANISDASPVVELSSIAQTSASGPLYFQRGCYAVVGGTTPKGEVYLLRNTDKRGSRGPMFYSSWGMRYHGNSRRPRANNV